MPIGHMLLSRRKARPNVIKSVSTRIRERLSELSYTDARMASDARYIFKVRGRLLSRIGEPYEPRMVSIGPYHHGKDKLKVTQTTKLIYLKEFLDRKGQLISSKEYLEGKSGDFLEKCVTEAADEAIFARSWYGDEKISHSSEMDFVEMILLDVCFILELLRKMNPPEQPTNDIILDTQCVDLLGVENQVPFFTLVRFCQLSNPSCDASSEVKNLAQKLTYKIPAYGRKQIEYVADDHQVFHLLDFVYRACTSSFAAKPTIMETGIPIADPYPKKIDPFSVYYISSASELQETSGVKFEDNGEGQWLDITWENGVIKIPHFIVDVNTERLLRSLIAYEQHYNLHQKNRRQYITDYAIFMDRLVNSARDVEVLRRSKIIINKLNDDQAVSDMFSRLTRDLYSGEDFCYAGVFREVDQYAKSRWNIWWTKLMRTYFNSPWSFISFVAATVALILSFLQTLFTIMHK